MRLIAPIFAVLLMAGCASSTPTIDTSPDAQLSFDGLFPVKGGSFDAAWARNDVDLTKYSKLMLEGVGVEYRPGGESGRTWHARTSAQHFEVTEAQKADFEALMGEVFREELAKSTHFTIVDEPGPDVLLVRGALLDVVSFVPPDTSMGSRDRVYLSRVGEATIVLELRDSITEAILARAVDRRAAEASFGASESNRVRNRSEVRRMASAWARMLRTRLDEFGGSAQ